MDNQNLWNARNMNDGDHCSLEAGPLHIRMERRGDEFHYHSQRAASAEGKKLPEESNTPEWQRWICGTGSVSCQLKPLTPPRAVIVRPAMPLQIVPGAGVELFVSIPVWVQVCLTLGDHPETAVPLLEEPTVVLSNSWFGLPVDGEPCFALRTRARRRIEELRPDVHLAVCPLTLRNEASEPLAFERLCIRLQHVGIYAGQTHLWTHHGQLVYRGEETVGELKFDEEAPSGDGEVRLLSEPREQVPRGGLAQRAFDSIRNFSNFRG